MLISCAFIIPGVSVAVTVPLCATVDKSVRGGTASLRDKQMELEMRCALCRISMALRITQHMLLFHGNTIYQTTGIFCKFLAPDENPLHYHSLCAPQLILNTLPSYTFGILSYEANDLPLRFF